MEIVVNHASKIIHKTTILEDVSLNLCSGRIYGLHGANGSGKTMFLRMLAGLIHPTSGQVLIDGMRLGKDIDFPPSMGLLIENPAFLPHYTGMENLKLLAALQNRVGISQLQQSLIRVGLKPDDHRRYRKYSLGMKQRLGIAAAIMEEPELILLDEPTNALDDSGIEQVCSILCQERNRGALIVMACHDGEVLDRMSDEIFKVNDGHIERKEIR